MNEGLKKIIKPLLMKYPRMGIAAFNCAKPFRLRSERRAYRGNDNNVGNGRPSIVFFTHHRCASMMMERRLRDLLDGYSYQRINYMELVSEWQDDERRRHFQLSKAEHYSVGRFNPNGRLFSPLRYYIDIPDIDKFKTIILLRDPRDVLVSRYYSEKYAHVRLNKRFLKHSESLRDMNVDSFALKFAPKTLAHYCLYMEHAKELKDSLYFSYEYMIKNFHSVVMEINEYLELGRSNEEIRAIAQQENFKVDKENKFSHKRNVKDRGFENKLKPETINQLTEMFGYVLEYFGWEGSRSDCRVNPFSLS